MFSNIFRTILLLAAVNFGPINSHWSGESTNTNSLGKLSALDVICGKDHMTVRAEFAGPFHGTVSSKGTFGQDNCVYIKPYSGVTHATFKVYYDQCGTKPDLQGKYYENTVVIQYGTDIIEAWDEAKRLRCEWFEAYEKPATFRPAIPVADLDVVEMNFQGDDIDCWMEIQEGKGPWGREVSRIVPVGQPMTIVIAINDYNGQFDMRVKSCFAHDGVKPPIHMTDEFGCVLRPKMLTKFNKVRDPNGKATVISYSHFYAFKFPDSMNVQIQCTVEVCRHGCPDACQKTPYVPDRQIKQQTFLSYGGEQQSSSKHREIPQLAADSSRQQASDDKIERNSVNQMRDEDNPSMPQDLQNSGSVMIPGQSEIPNSPPNSNTNNNHNNANHRNTPVDSSVNPNFESSRISGPVYRGSINGSSSPEDIDEGRRESASESGDAPSYEPGEDKLEEESKLHEKVVNMKIPSIDEDGKVAGITEQDLANLPSSTLDKAAQIFRDLGMNVDMSNFATGFVDGMNSKNLAQILDNDRIRELAESTGIKLAPSVSASGSSSSPSSSSAGQALPSVSSFAGGPSDDRDRLPQVQPLVSGPIVNGDEDSVSDNVEDDAEGKKKHSDGYGNRISESASTNSEYWTSPSGSTSPPPTQQQNNPVSTSTSVPSQSSLKPNHDRKGQLDGNSTRSPSTSEQQHQHPHPQQQQQPVARPNLHHPHSIQPNNGHTVAHTINIPNRNSAQQPPASILISELSHLAEQLAPGLDHRAHGPPTGQHRPNERMKNLGQLNGAGGHRNGHGHIGQQKPLPPSIHLNQAHSTADLAHHLHAAVAAQQQQLQNPVAQIVNIPLGFPPFSITPTNLNGLPNILAGQQAHLPHRKHMIRDHQNLHLNAGSHLNVPQPPRPMNSKPSILASLGNHLPHFNLPSFLSPHIQRQDSPKGNNQGANINKLHQRQIQMTFPQGPRSFRSRRSPSKEPLVNVKRGYQVVTSIDLSFMPNTTDLPEIYSGRREDIVYGVCMPFNGLIIGLTLVTLLVLFALITSLCFMKRLKNLKKQRQMNYIR